VSGIMRGLVNTNIIITIFLIRFNMGYDLMRSMTGNPRERI
jgi:hypothetical protein